jgi:hypothetical protein
MRNLGFSTGALARDDVQRALHLLHGRNTRAVEYSALRSCELAPMIEFLEKHGLGEFSYVAFHAPGRFSALEEGSVVAQLLALVRNVPHDVRIVVHPDTIHEHSLWRDFGDKLCVENMDHRKAIGRTADELRQIFEKLPQARLCFDIGHAHEIDRSMSVGYEILRRFRNRLAHLHASEVSDDCEHRAFSASSHAAFAKLAQLIPLTAPVILEMNVPENQVEGQLAEARRIFR